MAISFHAAATAGGSSTAALTGTCTSLAVTKGDLIIVCMATTGDATTSVTDSSNNIYSPSGTFSDNAGSASVNIWKAWANATGTITTITGNWTPTTRWSMVAASYTGVPQTKDFAGKNSTTSTTVTLTVTIEDNNNWLIIGGSARGTGTYANTSPTTTVRTSKAGAGTTTPGAFIADATNTTAGNSLTVSVTTSSAAWASSGIEITTVPDIDGWQEGQLDPPGLREPIEIVGY